MLQRGRALKKQLGSKGGAFMNRTSALIREILESWLTTPTPCEDTAEDGHLWTGKWVPIKYQICQHLDPLLSSLQNCENLIAIQVM